MNKQELIERLEKASNVKNWNYEDLSTELLDITYELRNVFEQLDEPSREECEILRTPQDNTMTCSKCDFHGIGEIIRKYCNYCPNCGAKIKKESL